MSASRRAAAECSISKSPLVKLLSQLWRSPERAARALPSRLRFESIEPRVLLSADLAPEAAAAMAGGLERLGERVGDFISGEALLDSRVPLLLDVRENQDGIVVDEAPSIRSLFAVAVDANNDNEVSGGLETELDALDVIVEDGVVTADEFLKGWFFDPVSGFLGDVEAGDTTEDFENFLKSNDRDRTLNLPGGRTVEFEVVDAKVGDTTEDPDAEVTFGVGFALALTQDMPLDLGIEADALRLLPFDAPPDNPPDGPPLLPVRSALSFGFSFGVHTGGQTVVDEQDFFVRSADPLLVSVTVDDGNGNPLAVAFNLNIGFLGAEVVGGSFQLEADVETTLLDPDDPEVLGFVDSQHGVEQTGGEVVADTAVPSADLAHDAGFFLRIGNLGIATPVSVIADDNAGDLNNLLADIEAALATAGLDALVSASLENGDTVKFSLVSTTGNAFGFGNEELSLDGELVATPPDFEPASTVSFLLSVGGAVPALVKVRFPDPSRDKIGFGANQDAMATTLVAQNAANAGGTIGGDGTATLTIQVREGDGDLFGATLDVDEDETAPNTNGTAQDLVDDLNEAIEASVLDGKISASLSGGKIVLNPLGTTTAIHVQSADAQAEADLGFADGQLATLRLSAANPVSDASLSDGDTLTSDEAHIEITVTTTGGTETHELAIAPGSADGTALAAAIDAALSDASLAIGATFESGRIVLTAQGTTTVLGFSINTVNDDIDELVDDVNRALDAAGIGGQVNAVADGTDLKLESTGGQSLEISRTLTFDAGVTFDELDGAATADLFSPSTSGEAAFKLPVQVLPGLLDPNTGLDWDPADVAIVGNFNPFGDLATFDPGELRFNLNLVVDPASAGDPPVAVPEPGDLSEEIRLVNFAELLQFNVVAAEGMVGLISSLGQSLESIGNSGQFALYGIPFSAASLSDLLVYGELVQTELVYDYGADGELDEDPDHDNGDTELTDDGERSRLLVRTIVPNEDEETVELLASFVTAQQLAGRLSTLLDIPLGEDGINATYNPDDGDATGNELSYTISLRSQDRISVGVEEDFESPFQFDVPLAPFREFTVDSAPQPAAQVTLNSRTSLDLTFGVDLDPVAPIDFSDGSDPGDDPTTIASLNNETGVGIKLEYAVTGEDTVRQVFGISSDASFAVAIDGGAPVPVTLLKVTVDATNGSLDALRGVLEDAINGALDGAATVSVSFVASEEGKADNRLVVTLDSGGTNIKLVPVSGDPSALNELGFEFDPDAGPGSTVTALRSAPSLYALTDDASFTIHVSSSTLGVIAGKVGQNTAVTVEADSTAGNRSIGELVADVNNALRLAGLLVPDGNTESGVRATFDAGRLVLTGTDVSTQFSVVVNNGTAAGAIAQDELGLADGTTNADQADLIVIDRNGIEHRVVLDGVDGQEVHDLVDALSKSTFFEAGPNASGSGLRLTDITDNPDDPAPDTRDPIRVATVNGSLAALKLGFLTNPTNPDDADNENQGDAPGNPDFIDGGPIGTQSLPDRFFVRDGRLGGAFTMDLPISGAPGDALVGIVGVDVVMHGGLGGEVTSFLQSPGGAPGSKVTLAEIQEHVGANNPAQQIVTDPVVSKLVTLNYDGQGLFDPSFTPGAVLTGDSSGARAIILEDDRDLLSGSGTVTLFNVVGDFDDDELIEDSEAGSADADGSQAQQTHFGEFELDFSVKPGLGANGFGSNLQTALNGHFGTIPVNLTGFGDLQPDLTPVAPAVELVDLSANLGALDDFTVLDYEHLADAVEELESLVLLLEDEFSLLEQTLPLVNTTVGELLNLSQAFSLSVNNFRNLIEDQRELLEPGETDVPTLTLQGMAQALRGAFGLPDASTGVIVDLEDGLLTIDFDLEETISTTLGLDIDLSEGGLPNLTSGKILEVAGTLGVGFRIGIDLANPDDVYLFNPEGGIDGSLSITGDGAEGLGLVFQAMVGETPVMVRDGLVDIELEFSLGGLDFSGEPTPGRKLLADVGFGDFTASVPVEDFNASIPLFDPQGGFTGFIGEITALGDLDDIDLPDLDVLAAELETITANLAEFNPLDNLLLLSDNVDFFFEGLQDFLDLDLFNIQLPIVGSKLADGARFIEDFRDALVSRMRDTIESATDIQIGDVTDLIQDFFASVGPDGIDVENLVENFDLLNEDFAERYAEWRFTLSDTLTVPFNIDFDIGVPLLGMDVDIPLEITIGWAIDMGIGVSFAEGAYILLDDDDGDDEDAELRVFAEIDLPGSETFRGTLGFLELIVENQGSGARLEFAVDLDNDNGGGERLGISDLGSLALTPLVSGGKLEGNDYVLDFDLTVGVTGFAAAFPNISAHFILDWGLEPTALGDLSGDAVAEGLRLIALNDVSIDGGSFLNSFLGPVLGEIQKFTEPFEPIIQALTTPIPIVSDLADQDITLLDLAGVFGEVDTGFIDWIETVLDVISIINDIGDETGLAIEIGDLKLFDAAGGGAVAEFDKSTLFDPDQSLDEVIPDVGTLAGGALQKAFATFEDALQNATPGGGDAAEAQQALTRLREGDLADLIAFPFLDDPLEIVGLLLGHDAKLITLDAPRLFVGFDYTQVFPIFGPLAASVGLGFNVGVDFSFGFDTYGFRRYADSGFTNPALIADGFFLGDRENITEGADINELFFEFNLTVAAELNLAIARAGAAVQGTAFIGLDLFDPDNDGAIHISELVNTIENQLRSDDPELAPLSIFDLTGKLTLELFAFLIIDFGVFEVEYEFPITPEIEVFTFEFGFERPPILGTDLGDGTLQLNIGPNAIDRLNGDTRDGSEEIFVTKVANGIELSSPALGVNSPQLYRGDFSHIVGLGGQGDDTIVLEGFDESEITFVLEGGAGNDTITFIEDASVGSPATGAGAVIRGDEGNDTLIGSHLDDLIIGGEGDDHIEGGRGYDLLFGDVGATGVLTGGNRYVAQRVGAKDGDDVIYGGSSTDATLADADADDIIVGAGGDDELHGSGGHDVILADGGRVIYGLTDGHLDVNTLRPADFVPNDMLDPTPAVTTSQKIENLYRDLMSQFSGTDLGAGGNDQLFGDGGDDFLFGGSGDDLIEGGANDDYAVGGLGFDTIRGGADDDVLFGNAQNDTMEGNGGSDVMSGGFGDDVMHGNEGDDYMVGGRGLDVMYGDENDDEVWGEGEPDVLFGGIGDDLVVGGVGADIMFGDDGIVAKLDKTNPANDIRVGIGNPALITAAIRNAADTSAGSLDLILTDVTANDGNDIMSGNAAGDIMLGGGGDDVMGGDVDPRLAVANTPEVTTETGRDILIGDGGIVQFDQRRLQRIASVISNEAISYRDTIYGDNGNDVIIGGQGSDGGDNDDQNVLGVKFQLAGGHGPGRGETDPEVTDDDIIIGDNGELLYADSSTPENFGRLHLIRTTDLSNDTGGADTAFGEIGDDVILGGVNGSVDILHGSVGNDVILGDNGELDFDFDDDAHDLDTLDLIRSYRDGLGGIDEVSGSAGDDVLIGGTAGDTMYGDDADASNGDLDGEDIMLGDNGDIFLIGTVGRLKVRVADMPEGTAVDLITTTDDVDPLDPDYDTQEEAEAVGGPDTMSGNAKADVMIGGVNADDGLGLPEVDVMYGDRELPKATTIEDDADDILLGDNGLLDFTFDGDTDRNTLDLIRSFEDALGGTDVISGNKGQDVAIGGTAGDQIFGDDVAASAGSADLGDLLLGDNADVFLVAANGAMGGDAKLVLGTAVFLIRTTDEDHETTPTGGVDEISGNADGDIIAGGVEGDTLYGDAASVVPELDGDDVILGDNGAFEWLSTGRLSEIHGIDIEENNLELFAKYDAGVPDADLTTLDLITTEQPNNGGRDTIYGDEGNDLAFGGTDLDWMYGDDGNEVAEVEGSLNRDTMFGDHGRLYPQFSVLPNINSRNFFAIDTGDGDGGEGDLMWGEEGDDVMLGQQGDDRMWGGTEDDDMIGGHNVSGGFDELTLPAVQATLNPPMNDLMDGGSGDDAMAGDNAIVWRRGDDYSPRFRTLDGTALYTTGPDTVDTIVTNVSAGAQSDPDNAVGRDIELVDHSDGVKANPMGRFGADVMAGGADSDVMYGQLGNDLMQGDGDIGEDDLDPDYVTHHLTVTDSGMPDTGEELYFNVPELASDDDDYMEGNGGDDLMYGGLGQDDIIGGSSALFGLTTEEERPDGSDILFGGAGAPVRLARNDFVGSTDTAEGTELGGAEPTDDDPSIALVDRHSRDADYIMGDNANVYRIVGPGDAFLEYNFDQNTYENRGDERIIVRAMEQLDYTLGGGDYEGGGYNMDGQATPTGSLVADNGAGDLIHGESGDDQIFGMTGSDVMFGESDDDDIVGGYGNDWISGGTGQDGVLGDDGLVYTSRNSTLGEPLYGVVPLLANDPSSKYNNGTALNEVISTPGDIQYAVINIEGELKKTADLVPFSFDPDWIAQDDEFPDNQDNTPFADDIIFGGLGGDFLHGGSGDDAISGAEALEHAHVPMFDVNGDPDGVLDLGYNAFTLADPIHPGDSVANPNPGDVLAFNPQDLDGQHLNNRFRAGEFFLYDEYDPRTKILLDGDGNLWKDETQGASYEFLLNFDKTEGVWRAGGEVPKATGQQTPFYDPTNDDGKDAIFGDLGNDWLVGGTGRDNVYGGWGNDLLNADDDHGTNGDLNDQPDTHPFYEDRAYGGAGRDILIGNTGGDRLIDWVGEYNSYIVPYAPFGQASVSRTMMPHLHEFLYALSAGDGADFTRFADAVGGSEPEPTNNNPIPSRNGEPHGELGLVLQQDFAWGDQTGAPADPQAGNIPGGPRDVLRSAGFQDGSMEGFFVDTGKFSVESGQLQVAADSPQGDAVSVYHVDEMLPGYFEVQASISVVKPTAGWKANAYVVFDYVDEDDFKFAGIDDSTNKLVVGHRAPWGWAVDKQTPFQVKPDTNYNMLIAINGVNVTVVVDNKASVTHTFAPRVVDGFAYGLNYGLVGVGSDSSRGTFDNIAVKVLPPQITFEATEDFDGASPLFPAFVQTGDWSTQPDGSFAGAPAAGQPIATALMDLGVNGLYLDSLLDLSATVNTATRAGFVFDRYSTEDFKYVALDAATDQVIIGHHSAEGGWATDATFGRALEAGTDYELGIVLKNAAVTVKLDGQVLGGHLYNAVTVDGDFGLLAIDGPAAFDDLTVKTDDAGFVPEGEGESLLAATSAADADTVTLTQSELDGVVSAALTQWIDELGAGDPRLAALAGVRFSVADLDGDALGYREGSTILVDVDAAGHGWFVDASTADSSEFRVRLDENVLGATRSSDAYGRMDLLTVIAHEIGHVLGFDHDAAATYAVMQDELAAGVRYEVGSGPAVPAFDMDGGDAGGSGGPIDWLGAAGSWSASYSPYTPTNLPGYLVMLGQRNDAGDPLQYDSLGQALLGRKGKSGA